MSREERTQSANASAPSIAVFAYNFPHKKTQDIIIRLYLEGYHVALILAADPVPLDIPSPSIRVKIKHRGLLHPRRIAERLGIEYVVANHNSREALLALTRRKISLGVIAGARILKGGILHHLPRGILNLHPGLIPEARGLDAMLWSIHRDVPLGVTAHLIDEAIDAGLILVRRPIAIQPDDTLLDLSERLYEVQLDLLPEAVDLALDGRAMRVENKGEYHGKMSAETEQQVVVELPEYLQRHAEKST